MNSRVVREAGMEEDRSKGERDDEKQMDHRNGCARDGGGDDRSG